MGKPWLHIIGLGEDGPAGLSDASREILARADVIFGGPRHLELVGAGARGRAWPIPFDLAPVLALREGRPADLEVVVLASGDPFWHGAGGSLVRHLSPQDWICHPAVSSVSWAAARLGWRLEEVTSFGLHAAPLARMRADLQQGAKLVVTLRGGAQVPDLGAYLTGLGFGASELTVFEALGGPRERRHRMRADQVAGHFGAPVLVAIAVAGGQGLPRGFGLPDDLFTHHGQITKRPVRALTLSALAPRMGERLWDLGAGCGSISVEWALAGGRASALEPRPDRLAQIGQNAAQFGVEHRIDIHEGQWPQTLPSAAPDAVFIGGGLSREGFEALWARIPAGTRLVGNAVTLESEALYLALQAECGGHLLRVELAEEAPLGRMRGWNRARPILQWSAIR
ncbi:precorrin-6y C5,15-methyltransferase (decarboxylating) subunit CbiE [Thioclava litoralis]|uniref:Precorrin-6y C5,15-methyltransferase (Decarboxylating) subunit CbiE n=1 Tax=Thioclava litoralis TaxID=3076557 RepID=A0ABZ1DZC8_9RHOB|nr:precorrin-6y C5,15-methyltransferase (decarboxylating) subunit CbiE [Thioclava sp. FTW29]